MSPFTLLRIENVSMLGVGRDLWSVVLSVALMGNENNSGKTSTKGHG